MKAVLFDLDGTLLDTLQDIADACNAALTRHNFPPHPVGAYRYFVGEGVPALISRVMPEGHHDPTTLAVVAAAYRDEYQRRWNVTTRPECFPWECYGDSGLRRNLAHQGRGT